MKPVTEILLSAAFVLTPPGNWTRHFFARNGRGQSVNKMDDEACKWCALGAVEAAAITLGLVRYMQVAENYLWGVLPAGETLIHWNDVPERTHAEVLAALYKAAELAEAS